MPAEPPHSPPSAPTSPLPKRTKQMASDDAAQAPPADTAADGSALQDAQPPPGMPDMSLPGLSAAGIPGLGTDFSAGGAPMLPPIQASMLQDPLLGPPMPMMPPAVPALQVKKLHDKARTPTRGSEFAAGYDLYSAEAGTVPAHGKAMLGTGIAVAVPPGTYGRVAPRSGLASKHSIATGAGVIDYDYRGEVKLLLFNHSDTDFKIEEGDRVAQLVLERIVTPAVVEVDELEGTERGAGGFGSTGGFGGLGLMNGTL